jgi:TRAP-type C4-dicarboxylate transport system permease small subunit
MVRGDSRSDGGPPCFYSGETDDMALRDKIKRVAGYVFEMTAALFFLGFFALILLQVFVRYVIQHPFQWTEEFVGMVFIAAAAAVDEHLNFDLGINYLKRRSPFIYKALNVVIDVIALIFLFYLLAGSYNRVLDGWNKLLPGTGWKVGLLYIPPLVGSAMLIVYTLLDLWSRILALGERRSTLES